jgi:hypothetical protein
MYSERGTRMRVCIHTRDVMRTLGFKFPRIKITWGPGGTLNKPFSAPSTTEELASLGEIVWTLFT